jgi:hypothetical protein
MSLAITKAVLSVAGSYTPDALYLTFLIGGLALVTAFVASMLWRSRQVDVSWLILVFALLAVVLASGVYPTVSRAAGSVYGVPVVSEPVKLAFQVVMLLCVGGALQLCGAVLRAKRASVERERVSLRAAEVVRPVKFLFIAAELGALVLIMRLYSVENKTFSEQIMAMVLCGFLLHELMPLEWRPSFFLLLSFSGIYFVFGWASALWLIGLGLLLLSVFHLPLRFSKRAVIALLIGIALAGARFYWANANIVGVIWPILGSMFMFRLISYAHYLKHHKPDKDLSFVLSYFFLLPNVVFPLFPIVDYATFRRTYYNSEKYASYQTGINWIARGVTHLLLYRLVYHYLLTGPGDVTSFWSLFRYIVSNFLLILRLSGQFHVVVGILHLFGFNLPEIMHRYWLAFSFSEFWRRANIYWKDFMQKTVFFPTYFQLRNHNATTRVLLATIVVFAVTALLHTYQWFWLRGTIVTSWPEVLFWTGFGVLVAVNALREEKHSPAESIRRAGAGWPGSVAVGLRAVGTFMTIAILWSLWISNSLSEWLHLWTVSGIGLSKIDTPALICLAVVVAIMGLSIVDHRSRVRVKPAISSHSFAWSATATAALLMGLYAVGSPGLYGRWNQTVATVFSQLRTDELNEQDLGLLQRAYYENLTRINRLNPRLADLYMKRREQAPNLEEVGGEGFRPGRRNEGFLRNELIPLASVTFKGAPFHVNRWGMRGKDCELQKPVGTVRIALMGGSPVMGSGVGDDETFAAILEDRLNREARGGDRYEMLNFGVGGYGLLQRLAAMEEKAFRFNPDVVFWIVHPTDAKVVINKLVECFQNNVSIPFPEIVDLARRAGLDAGGNVAVPASGQLDDVEMKGAQLAFGDKIVTWIYQRVVDDCRKRNILPVYIFLPSARTFNPERAKEDHNRAWEAGFETFDLSDVFSGETLETLRIAPWDFHFNKYGHRLVADRLYRELHARPKTRERFRF